MWCRVLVRVVFVLVPMGVFLPASVALAGSPEGRVYEQVSPELKAGYPVFTGRGTGGVGFALGGEAVKFASIGAFAGSGEDFALNPYVARRSLGGWATSGLSPVVSGGSCVRSPQVMSADLSRFAFVVDHGTPARACEAVLDTSVSVRELDGSFVKTSPLITTGNEAQSIGVPSGALDGRLVIVTVPSDEAPEAESIVRECGGAFVDDKDDGIELFEAEACALRPVAVDEQGKQISRYCDAKLGGDVSGVGSVSQPAAAEVFFSTNINSRTEELPPLCPDKAANPLELFVRVGGVATLEVSRPLPAGCTEDPCKAASEATPREATFQGASEDGGVVLFTTEQPLVNEDRDTGNDLYMATVGCPGARGEACGSSPRAVTSLVQISHDPHAGQAAEVAAQVVAFSPDGSRVYFVAGGDLLGAGERGALEHEGRPAPQVGAENLYVYDTGSGKSTFIVDLCSGPELSGVVSDDKCPGSLNDSTEEGNAINDSRLWSPGQRGKHEAQTTPDGRFLVFSSYGQLAPAGPERDADVARDVYRYDARTGGLRRVSVGEQGFHGDGNDNRFDADIPATPFQSGVEEQYELGNRAVSADGSTIVFSSSEPLSPGATNGQRDVYVWHEGSVGLISSGSATEADEVVGMDPSGRDVFFTTVANLAPGDTDGLRDIYDARVGGGFPAPPAERGPCSGDACQGPLSVPLPLLVPGSVSQQAGGNFAAPLAMAKKHKTRKKKHKAKPALHMRARANTPSTN